VIDTNVLLDWLVFEDPASAPLAFAVTVGWAQWIATPAMLEELATVLARPLAERWEASRKRALTLAIDDLCECWSDAVAPAPADLLCRDPADQKFIDLAVACRACTLITRDRALLDLQRRAHPRGVSIMSPAEWPASRATVATEP
jgi:uncharacterized protein